MVSEDIYVRGSPSPREYRSFVDVFPHSQVQGLYIFFLAGSAFLFLNALMFYHYAVIGASIATEKSKYF